ILAPAHLAERLDGLLGQPGFSSGIFDIEPLADGLVRDVGELRLEAHRVTHTDDSYAFRISAGGAAAAESAAGGAAAADGPGLVYSGDCGRADDLRPLLHPGDCLLSEVSFGLDPVPAGAQHISAADVAGVARDGAAGRILLTHLMSGRDRAAIVAAVARLSGGIPTCLVDPGDTFEL
ncbi:MAG: MBL fold metallo-hydrolase, partial [Candidatus Limnocylindrales bacterium]